MSDAIVQVLKTIAVELSILNKTLAERKQPEPTVIPDKQKAEVTISVLYIEGSAYTPYTPERVRVVGALTATGTLYGHSPDWTPEDAGSTMNWEVPELNLSYDFVRQNLASWNTLGQLHNKLLQVADLRTVDTAISKLFTRKT